MKRVFVLFLAAALYAGQPRYARLGEFEGPVEVQLQAADSWIPAQRNLPLPETAWLRSAAQGRVEVELDDGSVLRLGPESQGELSDYARLSTGQRVTLVSLDHGLAYFTGRPQTNDALTVTLPSLQVFFAHGARVRLEAEDGFSRVSVLEGTVRFSSPAAEIELIAGQTAKVELATPSRFFLDRGVPAMDLDRWSAGRDKALASPVSAGHVLARYGLADLDAGGNWIETDQYGTVWKPKAEADWAPFQNGMWRWYDGLGYTWIAGDSWGWLPYHFGRWARVAELGWVWAPSVSQVFKPGEVYWMRADKYIGWGALAPGEQWSLPDTPQQFLNVSTTYAPYAPEDITIDPSKFKKEDRPKDPLAVLRFAQALPSPTFLALRLDATRPATRAGSTRVVPIVKGAAFEDPTDAPPRSEKRPEISVATPPQQPTVIITPPPAREPEVVAVPYAVPNPVQAGTFRMNAAVKSNSGSKATNPPPSQQQTAAPPAKPAGRTLPAPTAQHGRRKRPRDRGEIEIYDEVVRDAANPAKQLVDLDVWTHRYRESDYDDERSVLYMQSFSKTGHPDRVVEYGARLLQKDLAEAFADPVDGPPQILSVYYLTAASATAIPRLTREQSDACRAAARGLLEYAPQFFTAERKPENLTAADWVQARAFMENAARISLNSLDRRRGTR